MRALIQRVSSSKVVVSGKVVGSIGRGFNVLIGIAKDDTLEDVLYIKDKILNLRIFEDENEKMNLSLKDVDGELLLISQFTLYGDCSNGNRPSFTEAAKPDKANELYEYIVQKCKEKVGKVETGIFGANMKVELLNDGPVTIIMEKRSIGTGPLGRNLPKGTGTVGRLKRSGCLKPLQTHIILNKF